MTNHYDDIIHLPHHQSERHPQMSLHDRAAQFSPFAALTGHEAAIMEEQRLTESFREPDENQKAQLDEKLSFLQAHAGESLLVTIIYFVRDLRKEGGSYVEKTGSFAKVDPNTRMIHLQDGTKISLEDIWEVVL